MFRADFIASSRGPGHHCDGLRVCHLRLHFGRCEGLVEHKYSYPRSEQSVTFLVALMQAIVRSLALLSVQVFSFDFVIGFAS